MSKKARKFMLSDKNTRRGSTYSTEWRQNISNALTGRTLSKEHRDNLKKAKVGTTTHPNSIKALKNVVKHVKGNLFQLK